MSLFFRAKCLFNVLTAVQLTGCLATGLTEVESEPGFDWDTLKRDQIVMTPLIDLRKAPQAPSGHKDALAFFSDADRYSYPEKFKQVFFNLRKDIRVFGAGGAYELLAKLPNLAALSEQVISKLPLAEANVAAVREVNQDIRFVFFFAVVDERLAYEFSYDFRQDQAADVKTYKSTRYLTVRLALWDSQSNKTVWRGTERLSPTESNAVEVRNSTKQRKVDGNRVYWVGTPERTSLAEELERNRSEFPGFPAREPAFSKSFDDFALALPLQPSEAKLIEYTHFTYHRPELSIRTSALGKEVVPALQLGSSSVINYRLRFGGALHFLMGLPIVDYQEKDYAVSSSAYGMTFDYEWTLTESLRLLTGAMAGAALFVIDEQLPPLSVDEKTDPETDGALFIWPRAFLLFGDKGGFQWGVGAAARFFDGIEEPVLKAHRPSPWSLDLSVAYAFRGF